MNKAIFTSTWISVCKPWESIGTIPYPVAFQLGDRWNAVYLFVI